MKPIVTSCNKITGDTVEYHSVYTGGNMFSKRHSFTYLTFITRIVSRLFCCEFWRLYSIYINLSFSSLFPPFSSGKAFQRVDTLCESTKLKKVILQHCRSKESSTTQLSRVMMWNMQSDMHWCCSTQETDKVRWKKQWIYANHLSQLACMW